MKCTLSKYDDLSFTHTFLTEDVVGWMKNEKIHREGKPATMSRAGLKEWFIDGKLHREDGPAVTLPDGEQLWYVNGTKTK